MKNKNGEIIAATYQLLQKLGVREIVVSAGSRNAPLVFALEETKSFRLLSHFEERSAGFFAMARAQESARPVAVICTSGTAVANLLPSVIEAHYSQVPLIVISADRPKNYRKSGAPQSIEQSQIFSSYVEQCLDWDEVPVNFEFNFSGTRPLHLNLCFSEPLAPVSALSSKGTMFDKWEGDSTPSWSSNEVSRIQKTLNSFKRPLVIVSRIPIEARHGVSEFLLRFRAPVFLEAASNLREDPNLQALRIKSSERVLAFEKWDGVIKIGGTPHLRFWRDLEEKFNDVPILSLGDTQYSGSTRAQHFLLSSEQLKDLNASQNHWDFLKFHELDRWFHEQKQDLFAKFPYAEPTLIHKLSRIIESSSMLFLGNSLPIREWELAADSRFRDRLILANRGANGIDGQLSSFFGHCNPSRPNWALLGDMTFLYDMSALMLQQQLHPESQFQICVLNNKGGRIFSRLPQYQIEKIESSRKRFLETEHHLEFSPLAQMFSLSYEKWDGKNPLSSPGPRSLIEIAPDPEDTEGFWRDFDAIWRTQ